jgi:hypothetical protein
MTLTYDPETDNCADSPGCGDQRVLFTWFQEPAACCPRCYENIFGGPPDGLTIVSIPVAALYPPRPPGPRPGARYGRGLALFAPLFDPGKVPQDHFRPAADRLLVAELTGEARHRAKWRPLIEDEQAAAVTELRELAAGRTDLLAEVAGIFEGTSEGEPDEPLARQAAQLCRLAGADETLIPAWVAEGKRRAEAARKPPHGG